MLNAMRARNIGSWLNESGTFWNGTNGRPGEVAQFAVAKD